MKGRSYGWLALVGACLIVVGLLIYGGSQRQRFPPWVIPVPDGVEIHDRQPVSLEDREAGGVELERELLIGDGPAGDANYLFTSIPDLAVDAHGRIYVYDAGNYRIQVFGPDGSYSHTIGGRAGEGPGDLGRGGRIAIVDGRVVYIYSFRLNAWSLSGQLEFTSRVEFARTMGALEGTEDGRLVGMYREAGENGSGFMKAVRFSLTGALERTYCSLSHPGPALAIRPGRMVLVVRPMPSPHFVVSSAGDVYVTAGEEYQVVSYAPSGEMRWALRASWPRLRSTPSDVERAVARIREHIPDATREEIGFPELMPALDLPGPGPRGRGQPILMDGHDHLFVFPFLREGTYSGRRAVDVYDAEGNLLFSGWMDNVNWSAARGDYVYSVERNPDTLEEHVVR